MVVQHNMTAINANRYFGMNNTKLSKSLEKLSSGYAINRAGDNAAGLAVSEKMRAQISGINQGVKNAQDGISMVQTFEGALTETDSILQRMKTLATQSANGSYDDAVDRNAIQQEFNQLNDELDQIADTDFNGVCVLNGGYTASGAKMTGADATKGKYQTSIDAKDITITAGANSAKEGSVTFIYENGEWTASSGQTKTTDKKNFSYQGHTFAIGSDVEVTEGSTFTVDFSAAKTAVAGKATASVKEGAIQPDGTKLSAALATAAAKAKKSFTGVAIIDAAGTDVSFKDADGNTYTSTEFKDIFGVDLKASFTTVGNFKNADGTAAAAVDDLKNAQFNITLTAAVEAADATATAKDPVSVSTSDSYENGAVAISNMTYADNITLQVGARSKDAVNFTFSYESDGLGTLKSDLNCTSEGLGTAGLSLASQSRANQAIDKIDHALNKVSMVRGTFGAIQNRLEHKIDNLNVTSENLTSAESRIRDTNMAEEMMNFTKNQILSQASQSMLAQANQLPQGVLSLLQ